MRTVNTPVRDERCGGDKGAELLGGRCLRIGLLSQTAKSIRRRQSMVTRQRWQTFDLTTASGNNDGDGVVFPP